MREHAGIIYIYIYNVLHMYKKNQLHTWNIHCEREEVYNIEKLRYIQNTKVSRPLERDVIDSFSLEIK